MAALWNTAGQYILVLGFLLFLLSSSFFFLFSSPILSRHRFDVYHTSRLDMALVRRGCRCETCYTRLAENTGRKMSPKIRHLRTIAKLCRAISSQLRHASTIGKKLVKPQYLPHTSPQYGELRPTRGWDRFVSLGHPYLILSYFPRLISAVGDLMCTILRHMVWP